MKSSKTSFLRNCISGWNVRGFGKLYYLCTRNSKERVFGGVWRSLSGEQVLTTRELFVSLFVAVSGPNGHYI